MQALNTKKAFGAAVTQYEHQSSVLGCKMVVSCIDPSALLNKKCDVVYWLSGLTCTDRNFIEKAGAFEAAVKHGVIIVCPDTSPRGVDIEGDSDSWDFGKGAGFYVNATEAKWAKHYKMYDYVVEELPKLIDATLKTTGKKSVMGHSMGGHGALTIALKNGGAYASVSAFAPICNPVKCPWGKKAFGGYLGSDEASWKGSDATELVASGAAAKYPDILIDVGTGDNFYTDGQLLPENFKAACDAKGQKVTLRMQDGYDHSYFFITSFVAEHVAFHAAALAK
eukprot:CAMPEP_0173393278 /NCGR_PEP_ID=MMETSP1356-20130122/22019_1 /TAXON_ID=77927 ORGANISM="Hemiselmis virescens, Strain PCC157" /NCGR_SAMPLE_ID=MMETSP1356 /ASSEMBLY_ACC=CAM_ASM_000847 /LENGTH=280 /DNA_ID=CAMNT_0014351279 /DNA_START=1 /DNA_END=843 /DNA_ORIENTATION=+